MPRDTRWHGNLRRLTVAGLLAIFITGCASAPQTRQLLSAPAGLPGQVELSNIPFFPQQRYQCGPAALATVLNTSGVDIAPDTLIDEIYLPARRGSLQQEILASTRRHGRLPYRITADMHTLLREVAAGNPVLVLQNLGLRWAPQWHYAVVVGFDLAKQIIILRSGTEQRHITDMHTFELTWTRGQLWGIVVMPAERLPATVTVEQALRTIMALEKVPNTTANQQWWRNIRRAYDSVLSRWPGNLVAQIGLGNSAYQLGELDAAEQAFRNAVRNHPSAGVARNNLAQVLLDRGKLAEAEKQARRAVKLGGQYQQSFRATLADIQQAKISTDTPAQTGTR